MPGPPARAPAAAALRSWCSCRAHCLSLVQIPPPSFHTSLQGDSSSRLKQHVAAPAPPPYDGAECSTTRAKGHRHRPPRRGAPGPGPPPAGGRPPPPAARHKLSSCPSGAATSCGGWRRPSPPPSFSLLSPLATRERSLQLPRYLLPPLARHVLSGPHCHHWPTRWGPPSLGPHQRS